MLPCWSPPVSIYAPINRVHKQGPKKREKIIRILRVFFFIATIYCQRDIFTLMLRSGKKYHLYLFNLQRIFLFDTVNYWTSYIFFSTFHILQLVFLATVSKSEEKKKACWFWTYGGYISFHFFYMAYKMLCVLVLVKIMLTYICAQLRRLVNPETVFAPWFSETLRNSLRCRCWKKSEIPWTWFIYKVLKSGYT